MFRTSSLIELQVSLLKFFGIWSCQRKGFWGMARAFVFATICVTVILSMFAASFKQTELTKFIISPLYSYNSLLVLIKAAIINWKSAAIEQLLLKIDVVPFFKEPGEIDIRRSRVNWIRLLPKILMILFTSGVFFFMMEPFMMGGIKKSRILPCWYPFEWEGKLGLCIFLYLLESIFCVITLFLAIATDTLLACLLLTIGGQLESLGYRLKTLPIRGEGTWKIKFVDCVQDYNFIYSICRELEHIFSGFIFMQTSSSCLLICLSAYGIHLAPDLNTHMRFAFFAMSMAYQVFLACYAGNDIFENSEKLQFYLYSSCWPDIPQIYRKMVLVFSLNLCKPIVIRFGFIQSLRLQTFSNIVNIAYKLYALLQQVPQ